MARGVVLLAPAERGIPVAEYSANLIKKSVVGVGHADKTQVQMMVRRLLPGCLARGADAADALAVAICHAHHAADRRALWRSRRGGAMIAMLAGVVDQSGADRLVLDVNGVGYLVFCSSRTLGARAARAASRCGSSIETHVREDHIHLYGFADEAERDWFRLLTTVQGVGAQAGAGGARRARARRARRPRSWRRTRRRLRAPTASAPKLAQRIVTELKDKVGGHRARPRRDAVPERADGGRRRRGLGAGQSRLSARRRLRRRRPRRRSGSGAEAALDALIRAGLAGARRDERGRASSSPEPGARGRGRGRRSGRRPSPSSSARRQLRDNLRVFIQAARARGEALDHVLLSGPPGLGKTTLAQIVAREMGVGFRATSGPVIQRAGDLAALLTNLQPRDVLFIDEIHRLAPAVEEILYPAMEDFQLDLIIGEGPAARSVRIDLPPFTLVGATTRSGLITRPLARALRHSAAPAFLRAGRAASRSSRAARACSASSSTPTAPAEIARRSRGTPRVAARLLRRVRDFAAVAGREAHRRRAPPTRR